MSLTNWAPKGAETGCDALLSELVIPRRITNNLITGGGDTEANWIYLFRLALQEIMFSPHHIFASRSCSAFSIAKLSSALTRLDLFSSSLFFGELTA